MEKKMSHDENDKVNGKDPTTEVVPKAQRRQYSYEYKRRILAEVDACTQPGEVGAILRREGLYYQIIGKWRNQFRKQEQAGLDVQKRGPKVDPQASELARLQRENERLRLKLERAELIIEVQKKVSQMLEQPTEADPDEAK